jgi:hypothetical protein
MLCVTLHVGAKSDRGFVGSKHKLDGLYFGFSQHTGPVSQLGSQKDNCFYLEDTVFVGDGEDNIPCVSSTQFWTVNFCQKSVAYTCANMV